MDVSSLKDNETKTNTIRELKQNEFSMYNETFLLTEIKLKKKRKSISKCLTI